MRFHFTDESFSFEALRTAGHGSYGGAELGEVLATCALVPEGDEAAWHRAWAGTAERVHRTATAAAAAGHRVSARQAYLRASNYYRTADFYRRDDPDHDAESARLAGAAKECFAAAAERMDTPVRAVRIPYEDTTLPGYHFLADDTGQPRPTVVHFGGFDSTLEELYFFLAAGALARGWNVLAFEGPGQGGVRREQGLCFRPDWEAVVTPVIDYALGLPGTDADRLVLIGTSLGGQLAARAAAYEPRLAACVLHDGLYSFSDAVLASLPDFLADWVREERDDVSTPVIGLLQLLSTQARWGARNGMWTFGAASTQEWLRMLAPYTLDGVAERIGCPTLVLDAENDQFFRGEARRVYDALRCEKEFLSFAHAEGSGEHCHEGAHQVFHQRLFDWLDTRLKAR
ncbi:alpha/beta hydrolase [Streptomyces sp. A7024]|uniref:Alpha/beta hydrolase n=1 Tax=Streptomyces coryli TaxID=1128680 RepID=A0A6G4TWM9_9ACTN|nr:alpha/beta hydrolase [Streptomyces coryli]NGN63518.1 alpha/beta hydrolase [Streptomyces coryli]